MFIFCSAKKASSSSKIHQTGLPCAVQADCQPTTVLHLELPLSVVCVSLLSVHLLLFQHFQQQFCIGLPDLPVVLPKVEANFFELKAVSRSYFEALLFHK